MSIDAVVNKEVLILGFKTGQSKFKEGGYTTVQFELDGENMQQNRRESNVQTG